MGHDQRRRDRRSQHHERLTFVIGETRALAPDKQMRFDEGLLCRFSTRQFTLFHIQRVRHRGSDRRLDKRPPRHTWKSFGGTMQSLPLID